MRPFSRTHGKPFSLSKTNFKTMHDMQNKSGHAMQLDNQQEQPKEIKILTSKLGSNGSNHEDQAWKTYSHSRTLLELLSLRQRFETRKWCATRSAGCLNNQLGHVALSDWFSSKRWLIDKTSHWQSVHSKLGWDTSARKWHRLKTRIQEQDRKTSAREDDTWLSCATPWPGCATSRPRPYLPADKVQVQNISAKNARGEDGVEQDLKIVLNTRVKGGLSSRWPRLRTPSKDQNHANNFKQNKTRHNLQFSIQSEIMQKCMQVWQE